MVVKKLKLLELKTLDFRRNAPKTPTAITLPKIVPEASSWTQKMRLGILYNLCAKSDAKQFFGEVMAIWVFSIWRHSGIKA